MHAELGVGVFEQDTTPFTLAFVDVWKLMTKGLLRKGVEKNRRPHKNVFFPFPNSALSLSFLLCMFVCLNVCECVCVCGACSFLTLSSSTTFIISALFFRRLFANIRYNNSLSDHRGELSFTHYGIIFSML